MSKTTIVILSLIGLGAISLITYSNLSPEAPKLGVYHESEGQQHLQSLDQKHADYKSDPPTSGPHYVQPAGWGVSDTEINDEQLVHNLEHGGIVVTYMPDMPTETVTELQKVALSLTANDKQMNNKGYKVIVAPRSKNKNPIQMTGWNYSLSLEKIEATKMQQFYRERLNKAPEGRAT